MKKISAVLLVLVLVGSVVFAGFTGSAEVSFGYDLDNSDFGMKNTVKLTGDLVIFEQLAEKAGSGDIYAEIKAELALAFDFEDVGNKANVNVVAVENVKVTSAKIIGDNWYVGILGAMAAPNFASSVIDEDLDEEVLDINPSDYVTKGAGVEVGFAGYKVGVSVPYPTVTAPNTNNVKNEKYFVFGSVATPEYELGDGLTMAFGAAGRLAKDAGNAASFSAKAAYAMDDLAVSLATDLLYANDKFDAEVALNAAYDPVTVDVYFATSDDNDADDGAVPPVLLGPAYPDGRDNILSAKVSAVIDPVTLTVSAKDIINATIVGVDADWSATDEITVNANGGYTIQGVDKENWYAGAGVTYAVEEFTAKLSGKFHKGEILEMAASVESTTVVPGATLKLAWTDAKDLLDKGVGTDKLGKVTASAKIAF